MLWMFRACNMRRHAPQGLQASESADFFATEYDLGSGQ